MSCISKTWFGSGHSSRNQDNTPGKNDANAAVIKARGICPGEVQKINHLPKVAPPSTGAFFVSRKRVLMYEPPPPWLFFIIYQLMRRRGRLPNAAVEDGATAGFTHVFEMNGSPMPLTIACNRSRHTRIRTLNRVSSITQNGALTYPDSCVTDLDIGGSHEYGVQVHLLDFLMFFNET